MALKHRHYGYRRIGALLRREGWQANHKWVLRLMREDNLLCLRRAVDAYLKISNDNTKIVPGHGALAKKADLVASREMLVTSRDRVQKLSTKVRASIAAKPLADLDKKWAANDR